MLEYLNYLSPLITAVATACIAAFTIVTIFVTRKNQKNMEKLYLLTICMSIIIDREYIHKPEQVPPMIEKHLNELRKYYKKMSL